MFYLKIANDLKTFFYMHLIIDIIYYWCHHLNISQMRS